MGQTSKDISYNRTSHIALHTSKNNFLFLFFVNFKKIFILYIFLKTENNTNISLDFEARFVYIFKKGEKIYES